MLKKIIRNKYFWISLIIVMVFGINFLQINRKDEIVITPEMTKVKDSNVVDRSTYSKEKQMNDHDEMKEIMVDIKGAVKSPGVFRLKVGNRVYDAIRLAGGFHSEADKNKVNLAEKLVDEMVIYVPKIGEESTLQMKDQTTVNNNSDNKDVIDINNATIEELQKIPGIGPSKAKNILEYIETNGSFTSIDQLDEVNGIGAKSLEQMKPYILIR